MNHTHHMALWLTALLALGPTASTRAQSPTGTIDGQVVDQSGAVLPGVVITLYQPATGAERTVVSDTTGGFRVPLLPVGVYDLTATLAGFDRKRETDIRLTIGQIVTQRIELRLAGITQTVDVTGGRALLERSRTHAGATVEEMAVQHLPVNGRNFLDFALLTAGVTRDVRAGDLSFAGQRGTLNSLVVDGADTNNTFAGQALGRTGSGRAPYQFSQDAVQEFQINANAYAAEYGRAAGGVINVVTKSGTNNWRFSAYEFFRNDALNANSFFRKQRGCQADGTCLDRSADGFTDFKAIRENPPKLRYNNFGFTVGGPIKRDKLFVFYSQEWRRIERAPADLSANVPDPAWLTDPANANYVPPDQRDPNAVRLLSLWPAPNLGTNRFGNSIPNEQDTRQEVVRVDWFISPNWRLMGRYTHDLSETTEPGGLFFGTAIPNVATTLTDVPGQVFVSQLTTTVNSNMFNEFSFQFSSNAISSVYGENVRNTRAALGLTIPEIYPENREALIPQVNVSGLALLGANQLFDNQYKNFTFAENLTWQKGEHQFKAGALVAMEQKDELSGSATQGAYVFAAGGGRTAFQNFLRGNADGLCGAACTYVEPQREIASQFRWQRYEFYVQDSWRVTPRLRLDLGLRYSLQPGFRDENDLLTNFVPALYNRADAPAFDATAGRLLVGSGDPLNGIVVAGVNSPHGRAINGTDKNNFQPRLGFSYDINGEGKTVVRGGYGIYYDQPLMGVFLQNAFVNPPVNENPQVLNARLSNPAAGTTPATLPIVNLIATSDPFDIPRTQQWNIGVQRQLYSRGVIDVSYVGSSGDNLIQPVDINQAQPADVVAANGQVNRVRPFPGFGTINMRQTTARSRYHGLLVNFRHDAGRAGLLNLAYTLSRTKTDATNDRDAIDFPQNPLDLGAEYAIARTDRTHVFNASYVYELPFFRKSTGVTKFLLGGWQVSGITSIWSGPPISRVVNGFTEGGRRGIRVNQVSDPFSNLPADVPGGVYWFNPAAFAPPAQGQYGSTGRSIFRLPGVHQWDITLSKNFYPSEKTRLQFRADAINAFNHTQLDPAFIQNTCTVANCGASTNGFGQITSTRNPREIQLSLKFSWN